MRGWLSPRRQQTRRLLGRPTATKRTDSASATQLLGKGDRTSDAHTGGPAEILSIGTSDLPPGGESCAQFPVNALDAVGATGALLTLQESGRPDLAGFPPLPDDPERLEPDTRFWGAGCLQNPNRLVTWWIRFRQRDRAFYGLVAIGNSTTEETQVQVFQALSSFQVEG